MSWHTSSQARAFTVESVSALLADGVQLLIASFDGFYRLEA